MGLIRTLLVVAVWQGGRGLAAAPAGCFKDAGPTGSNQPGRQMHYQVCEQSGPLCTALTRGGCASACRSGGYTLYGVEAGHQCYCDNELAHPGDIAPVADCNVTCSADTACGLDETCGGVYRLFVGNVNGNFSNCTSSANQPAEPRNIYNGTLILSYGYLDQPYCQANPFTGDWTCITTASPLHEGGSGEHMISQVSADEGKTWSEPVLLEPEAEVDNSYGTLAMSKSGRLYCMYNMNLDNITKYPNGKPLSRVDELGHFVMKYSDDGGRTWSKERYEVPYRLTPLDLNNTFGGKVRMMWCVDQVKVIDGTDTIIYGFTKIGHYVQNAPQELWFLASENLMTEPDAAKVTWTLLPDGDHGILPPGVTLGPPADPVGDVLEEAHIVPLAMGGFYAVGRTTQGYLAATFTKATVSAGLQGWGRTGYATYFNVTSSADKLEPLVTATPVRKVGSSGYGLKNPRGPITPKRMSNGMYLLLFYNNAGNTFGQRDPYWLSCGIESPDHGILWSQPEIVLYDRYLHTKEAGGYPDFIQSPKTGAIYITETQKDTARIHKVEDTMLTALFSQHNSSLPLSNPAVTFTGQSNPLSPSFGSIAHWTHKGQGFSITLILQDGATSKPGTILLDSRTSQDTGGVAVLVNANGSIGLSLQDTKDSTKSGVYFTDPLCTSVLKSPGRHYYAAVVDAGPMIVTFSVDGLVCDGGHFGSIWASGWHWLPAISSLDGAGVTMAVREEVMHGAVYTRAVLNSEIVSDFRAQSKELDL